MYIYGRYYLNHIPSSERLTSNEMRWPIRILLRLYLEARVGSVLLIATVEHKHAMYNVVQVNIFRNIGAFENE